MAGRGSRSNESRSVTSSSKAATSRAELARRSARRSVEVEVADRDLRALAGQRRRGRAADAAGAAGDGDDLAVEGAGLLGHLETLPSSGASCRVQLPSDRDARVTVRLAARVRQLRRLRDGGHGRAQRDPARHAGAAVRHVRARDVERDDDPTGFWARSGVSDLGDPGRRSRRRSRASRGAGSRACASCSTRSRRRASTRRRPRRASRSCTRFMDASPETLAGVHALQGLTHLLFYATPRPGHRAQPELGGDRLSGPARRRRRTCPRRSRLTRARRRRARARGRRRASSARAAGGGVIAGELSRGGQEGRGARGGRLLQRVRLQPARAVGLPEPVPDGGAFPTADGQVVAHGGLEPRRRQRRSTGRTACAPRPGCARSGSASTGSRDSTAPTTTATSTPSGSASASTTAARTCNGPHQRAQGGLREARLRLQA